MASSDSLATRSDRQGAPVLISLQTQSAAVARAKPGDSPCPERDSEVGNVGRLGLARSVGSHDTPTSGLSELNAGTRSSTEPL